MSALRRIFLMPSVLLLSALFVLPLGVIILYSGLERGVYGGIGNTWTVENYSRLLDGLYVSILVRTFAISALATAGCLLLGFPLALFISRAGSRKRLYLQLVMPPVLDQFPGSHVRLDFSFARYRTGEYPLASTGADS